MGVTQETWQFLSAAVCTAHQLAQETCTRSVRKKLAVMHVTKIVNLVNHQHNLSLEFVEL